MRQIIVGFGEVGAALAEVLKITAVHDPAKGRTVQPAIYDVLHVALPYNSDFHSTVRQYQKDYAPSVTVIHSTVPVGTSSALGALHSPVRGVHPNLAEGLRTFVKFIGGAGVAATVVERIFEQAGIATYLVDKPENTEAMKLWETTQYGLFILLEKEIYRYCQEHGLDFETVYTAANRTYNDGYLALGRTDVLRPVLKQQDGPIGGHCVLPNAELLDSWIADIVSTGPCRI